MEQERKKKLIKDILIIILFLAIILSFIMFGSHNVSALSWYYKNQPQTNYSINNNTLNVNNSFYLQGYTPSQVANLFTSIWLYNQTLAFNNWLNGFLYNYNQSSSSMNYSNIALTNQSNSFIANQTINGNLTINNTYTGQAFSTSVLLTNNLVGNQNQYSPAIEFKGYGNSSGTSHPVSFRIGTHPAQTNSNDYDWIGIDYSTNGGAWTNVFRVNNDGSLIAFPALSVTSAGLFRFSARTVITSPADGSLQMSKWSNVGTGFNLLQFGGSNISFPAIKSNNSQFEFKLADDSAYTNIIFKNANFTGDIFANDNNLYFNGTSHNLNISQNISANYYISNSNIGITHSYSMLNSSSVQCWMNYTGGILTYSNC